jgi:hypothetical protein
VLRHHHRVENRVQPNARAVYHEYHDCQLGRFMAMGSALAAGRSAAFPCQVTYSTDPRASTTLTDSIRSV